MTGRRLRRWLILGVLTVAGPGTPGSEAQSLPAVELLAGGWLSLAAVEGGANLRVTESFGFGVRGWFAPAWWRGGSATGATVVAAFRQRAVRDVEFHYGIGWTRILHRREGEWVWAMEFLAGRRFSRRFGVRAGLSAVAPGYLAGGVRFFPKAYGVMSF